MTNNDIIYANTLCLQQAGIIGAAEQIHTYAEWKRLGYQVRRGEHAIADFAIWKKGKGRDVEAQNEDGEAVTVPAKPHFFLANAKWFATHQVEPA